MPYLSYDMARSVAVTAGEVASGLAGRSGAAAFVADLVAYAIACVDQEEPRPFPRAALPEDMALLDAVERFIGAWPVERWVDASAWAMVLSACRLAGQPAAAPRWARG